MLTHRLTLVGCLVASVGALVVAAWSVRAAAAELLNRSEP